jgi:predicted RNase H-like HicB family nuclease
MAGYNPPVKQVTFTIHPAQEGGFWAEADTLSISTEGDDLDELNSMIQDAVDGYFFDRPEERPEVIYWRFAAEQRVV